MVTRQQLIILNDDTKNSNNFSLPGAAMDDYNWHMSTIRQAERVSIKLFDQ